MFEETGGPEVLQLVEVEPREPGPGKVRVRVRAAGVQPFDVNFRAGLVPWLQPKFPQRVGTEAAGIVDAVGPDVTELAPGDEVFGSVPLGGHAEYVVAKAEQLVRKPAGMPWEVAGALSASGQTASTVCEDLAVASGETLLVHAAAGGVGSVTVQLARALGADVVGTASPRNHEYVRSLGAVPVEYGAGLVERVRAAAPQGVDAALDAAGTDEALRASVELVPDLGRVATITNDELADELGARMLTSRNSATRLAGLVELYEKGALRVEIYQAFDLGDIAAAHRAVESGHVRGKVVLLVQ